MLDKTYGGKRPWSPFNCNKL